MLRRFIPFLRDRRGVAAVEFAFVAPVIFMMTIGTIDVGRLVWSWSSLHHMAREATRYASVRGAEATTPMTTDQLEDYVNNRLIQPGQQRRSAARLPVCILPGRSGRHGFDSDRGRIIDGGALGHRRRDGPR
jgi:Flp pilus assembly pilin Flp